MTVIEAHNALLISGDIQGGYLRYSDAPPAYLLMQSRAPIVGLVDLFLTSFVRRYVHLWRDAEYTEFTERFVVIAVAAAQQVNSCLYENLFRLKPHGKLKQQFRAVLTAFLDVLVAVLKKQVDVRFGDARAAKEVNGFGELERRSSLPVS